MKKYLLFFSLLFIPTVLCAKIDLVTLPEREKVQLTIYNSADLTLVKDSRGLTLKKGANQLQFSWANTLIDPTSLELLPLKEADQIDVFELSYPPRIKELGVWRLNSRHSGLVPMEISFFTSGISWRAYYLGTLNTEETKLHLAGYVIVNNNSGEDYANAQTRLVVGKLNVLDEISQLARRFPPYGTPQPLRQVMPAVVYEMEAKDEMRGARLQKASVALGAMRPKEIIKEGLSEYFLYTIEGTESIPNGWGKRLPSFQAADIPVVNLYKYEEERYGSEPVRFLSFKNDKEHNLGQEPLPDGMIKVFRDLDKEKHLAYVGQDNTKYIPLDQEVELNLGPTQDILVVKKLLNQQTTNYLFNASGGNISGFDSEEIYEFKLTNLRALPVKLEITRNLPHAYWEIFAKDNAAYEKVDLDTIKFSLTLAANSVKTVTYKLILHNGDRQQR